MGPLLFLVSYLLVAVGIGVVAAGSQRSWVRPLVVFVTTSMPLLLWLTLLVRDALRFGNPVFDLVTESGRFSFYAGGELALFATPVWLLAGIGGLWIGARRRKRKVR